MVLTIGQLSAASGVPTSTIRFWERRGLLSPAARSGGQRRYTEDALSQVGMLLLCQDAGFTLAEIQELVTKQVTDHYRWRELVEAKMVTITDSLRKLTKAQELLTHALECEHEDITHCPKFRMAVDHRSGSLADVPGSDTVTASGHS
ncbi:MAG TPA: MerR family transcriptional regulator [Pseudonocardiaceae bacterium]|jgi:DNA-binding transcriptional MerR regulator|nr:MerR family transcriptional regulator [Pseudonocardiaceae bacterium]